MEVHWTIKQSAWVSHVCRIATFFAVTTAFSQDVFLDRWKQIGARQPAGVRLAISAPKTEFYYGEAIPLVLQFTSTDAGSYATDSRLYDRVGRMNYIEEFIADPAALTEDPLQGLQGGTGGMGGISGGPVMLSEKPFTFERVLNEWVRFRKPGEYRVYVISRRVRAVEGSREEDRLSHFYDRGKPAEVLSNVLTLKIHPAPETWVKEQIAAAKQDTLRFLDSPDAASELVLSLTEGQDVHSFGNYLAVLGSPYRQQLLPLMEQRLVAPDQPVWDRYLETIAQLAEFVESGGPMPSYPSEAAEQKSWQAEQTRRTALRAKKQQEYAERLISSLPRKQPSARAVSLHTLLNLALRGGPEPSWLQSVSLSLMDGFRDLPVRTQSMLLEYRWDTLKSPGMRPVLRSLIENPPREQYDPPIQNIAVRRLYELSPDEGRKIILSEIRRPTKNLAFSTLAMLPDASLPELNDALVERFDQLLIVRYASGDAVKRVKETYQVRRVEIQRQNLPSCAGPLVFYFLKFDPEFGAQLLKEDFARPSAAPACYDIGFQFLQLGQWAYSPALEQLAIDSLTSSKVPVKRGAAEVLGKFGSAAAQKPLWEAMEYFRSWWKGREADLQGKIGQEGIQLERALRIALAQSNAWKLQEPELRRLLELCSSEPCRVEVNSWLSAPGTI